MTMINPPHNISKQNRYGGGGCGYGGGGGFDVMGRLEGYECCILGSDLVISTPMAEDESRTESTTANEEGSSSKGAVGALQDDEERDQGWLQLGIGGGSSRVDPAPPRVSGLVELDLLPSGRGGGSGSMRSSPPPPPLPLFHHVAQNPRAPVSSSFFLQYPAAGSSSGFPHDHRPHHQKINSNWGFRPNFGQSVTVAGGSSSSSFLMGPGSYFGRPYQVHGGVVDVGGGGGAGPSSSDFAVIDPPRRPHSGLWFTLQASQNQSKEPFLPQIPKSFLRIKDARMTVRLLMKYLVNKLRLDSESEIEIRCRGQQLLPFLTLQHVRDHIWRSQNDAAALLTLLPDSSSSSSSTTDHVMVLHYARSTTTAATA